MKFLSFVAFFCLLIGLFLAGLVLWFNHRSRRNQAMALAGLIYAWWSLCLVFVYGAERPSDAFFWYGLSVSGILYLIPAFYWTYLDQAGISRRPRWILIGLLVAINTYLYVRSWYEGFFLAGFEMGPWGNVGIPNPAPYQFGYGFYLSVTALMIGLMLYCWHRAPSSRLRGLFGANAVGIILTSILSIVAVYLETAFHLPPLELIVCGFYLVGWNFYLMGHYRYLRPSPLWGAKHSVEYLPEAAFLLDEGLRIASHNQAALSLLGADLAPLENRVFSTLFDEAGFQPDPKLLPPGHRASDDVLILRRGGRRFQLRFSSRFDRFGDFSGATVILHPALSEIPWPSKLDLSIREAEIAHLVLHGASNKAIAAQLFVSEGTVKNHIYSIYKKCQVNSRLEFINKFLPLGSAETSDHA